MAISLVGTNFAVAAAAATSVTPATVASVAAGDVLICTAATGRTLTTFTNASYTNWTTLRNVVNSGANLNAQIIYRIADGTASDNPPSMAYGSNTFSGVSLSAAYRGVDTTTPFLTENAQFNASASTSVAAPALTNTDAGAWGVFFGVFRGTVTLTSWTPPTGMTERQDHDSGTANTNNDANEWADTAATVGTGTVTYTGTASASVAIGNGWAWAGFLKPAATATVTLAHEPPVNRARFRASLW